MRIPCTAYRGGRIAIGRLNPLCFLLGEYWSVGSRIGSHGFSARNR